MTAPTPAPTDPAPDLTPRQREVLDCIAESVRTRGMPPTLAEIGKACGITSLGSLSMILKALVRAGYLEREPATARGLRLTDKAKGLYAAATASRGDGRVREALSSCVFALNTALAWITEGYARGVVEEAKCKAEKALNGGKT